MGPLISTRVAIYARFSSDKQSDASIEDQVYRAREWLRGQGTDADAAQVFTDYAVSGASLQRVGMNALMDAIRRGALDVLITESVDRISRDVEDAARFRKVLAQHHVDLACLDGTRLTAGGKSDALMFGMRALFAEQYRHDLADKTRRGLEGRARRGEPTGNVPFGFRIVTAGDAKSIAVHADQAALVRRIFDMYLSGNSLGSIAATFNAESIAPPRAHSRRAGQGWMQSAVRAMLLNESYAGRWVYGSREWVKVDGTNVRRPQARKGGPLVTLERPELALVAPETFAAVQARFVERKGAPKSHRSFVLSGVVRCVCGARLTVNGSAARPYYRCSASKNRGTCDRRRNVQVGLVETLVFETVGARLDECVDEVLAICVEEIRAWQAERPDRGAALKREIDKRARAIASYVEAIADGYSRELGDKLRALQAEQARAAAELANIAADAPVLPSPTVLRERIRSLCDLTGALPVEEARELLRGVTGDIECEIDADGSFRLSGALNFAAMLNAPGLATGGVRQSLVAGAGFEPTTFGL